MELTVPSPVTGILGTIGKYGATKGMDFILEQASTKWTVRRIVQKDKKYIRQLFTDSKKRKCPTEEAFLLEHIFQDDKFLCPRDDLPKKKQDDLCQEYKAFLADCGEIKPREDIDSQTAEKLILCVNYHNRLVFQYFLSRSEKLMVTAINNKLDATGYSGGTLDSNNDFLLDNIELEYTHLQLDSILHAFRMDLRFYRLILLLELIAISILVPITIFQLSKFGYENTVGFTVTMLVSLVVVLILCFASMLNFKKIYMCERRVRTYSEQLWKLNFWIYKADLLNGRQFKDTETEQNIAV